MTLSHPRFLAFLAVFVAVTSAGSFFFPIEEATILGFDLAAAVFIALALPLWAVDNPEDARARAARDDGGRILLMLTAAAALAAILLALGRMIEGRSHLTSTDFAIVAGTLVLAWLFSNLVYAFHYAHLYYDQVDAGDAGGILFPEGGKPVFADFVYFAFVIGMTCQTADLDISSRTIRRVVTLHGLFAFFFNLGVLAMTINVLSGVL
ncbi:DUF1345 domain-containing protein [Tabrizicola sp. YIM 78059]|uniref:DUF1345 domain-containing protein n=1 Tax=Tabrizicola sp. YIM 78059 TaxID=2529861 RepID=UPI0010AAFA72|nr:DUF1345 domain-containing protein [Tabrizicola sp. YIM 78059]